MCISGLDSTFFYNPVLPLHLKPFQKFGSDSDLVLEAKISTLANEFPIIDMKDDEGYTVFELTFNLSSQELVYTNVFTVSNLKVSQVFSIGHIFQKYYDHVYVNLDPGETFLLTISMNVEKAKFEVDFNHVLQYDFFMYRGASKMTLTAIRLSGDLEVYFFGFADTGNFSGLIKPSQNTCIFSQDSIILSPLVARSSMDADREKF